MMRILAFLLAVFLTLGPIPVSAQTFMDTTDVVVVEVPVQVIRNGEPVRGLTAADFEVYDSRRKQTLTGFEAVDLAALGPEALATAELPVSARRHFLILYDLSFTSPESLLRGRRAAQNMVGSLHPTDLVAVATWSARQGPRLILGFTSDRQQIEAAVGTLGIPDLLDNRPPDPLRLALVEGPQSDAPAGAGGGMVGTGDAEMEETIEQVTRLSEEARITGLYVAVRDMSRSMVELAHAIGGIKGRKNVVFLSEGFSPGLLRGDLSHEDLQARSAKAASGEIWDIPHGNLGGHTPSMNAVAKMLEELRRADCVIQAVDLAGLRGQGDVAGGQDTLLSFARSTGGELYENTNDLGGAMQQMLRRTGVTYVLSFQPEKVGRPGTFHSLKVKLKNQPRGTRLVHRPGWYAPKPYTARSPIEKTMSAASQLLGGEEGGPIRTALRAVPAPGAPEDNGKARVAVTVEVEGTSLLAGTSGGTLPVEIYVYALDREGAVHGYMAQSLGLDLARVKAGVERSGVTLTGHLDLPPGEYRLRSLVRNGVTGAATVRSTPLTVPAFPKG